MYGNVRTAGRDADLGLSGFEQPGYQNAPRHENMLGQERAGLPWRPAAKASLAKGDVIVSVNGSSDLSLRQVRALFLAEPGTVEHLVIKSKDGKTHGVDLTLADYV